MVDLDSKDDITYLINKNQYYHFGEKTLRDYLHGTNIDCFESKEMLEKNPAQHPNKLGYNLISEEFYNYIVKNSIL